MTNNYSIELKDCQEWSDSIFWLKFDTKNTLYASGEQNALLSLAKLEFRDLDPLTLQYIHDSLLRRLRLTKSQSEKITKRHKNLKNRQNLSVMLVQMNTREES